MLMSSEKTIHLLNPVRKLSDEKYLKADKLGLKILRGEIEFHLYSMRIIYKNPE